MYKLHKKGLPFQVALGAGGGGRTRTLLPGLDFESSTSANSITPANQLFLLYKIQSPKSIDLLILINTYLKILIHSSFTLILSCSQKSLFVNTSSILSKSGANFILGISLRLAQGVN